MYPVFIFKYRTAAIMGKKLFSPVLGVEFGLWTRQVSAQALKFTSILQGGVVMVAHCF